MLRALVFAAILFLTPHAAFGQAVSVLRIKVVLLDADRNATPVPRHALLISDNPPSAAPRRVVTALDGTAELKLRPGSYAVESDQPVTFQGKAYQWVQIVEVVAGRDAVLELTTDNAEVESAPAAATSTAPALENDPSFLLPQWQASVVALWTPTTHASGFVVDASGLIATSQRGVGTATSVEVQLAPDVKVAATVLTADPARDIAILWIDPKAIASLKPVPLPCAQGVKPAIVNGQEIFTIGVPLRQNKGMTSGKVTYVGPQEIVSDWFPARGSAGGPVFTARGELVGITTAVRENDQIGREDFRIVRADGACDVFASAQKKMKDAAPPSATHLPIEPTRPFPVEALKAAAERRAGSMSPYQVSSSTFDVAFITPVLTYGAQYHSEQASRRARTSGTRSPEPEQLLVRPLLDFSNWAEYVGDFPPVLLVRVTPKLVEGFWTTVARGAARTQGVSIPPIKRIRSGFARLRAFCGDTEVTPIHPFRLEQRVSESDAIYEGLYVFDPGALGPQCGTVKLAIHGEKDPDKAETLVVDPGVIEKIWHDFMPYRALNR